MRELARDVSDESRDDIVTPYTVESLSTRGRLVRLGPSIDAILKRHAYPDPVAKVLGEAVTQCGDGVRPVGRNEGARLGDQERLESSAVMLGGILCVNCQPTGQQQGFAVLKRRHRDSMLAGILMSASENDEDGCCFKE